MALSAFDDKETPPSTIELKRVLGASVRLWDGVVAHVTRTCTSITGQWSWAGARSGWSLRLKRKDRVILYLTPQEHQFLAGVVLGEKAVTAAETAEISAAVRRYIEAAPRYPEGRGVRVPVSTEEDVETVQQLVALKMGV